ncbi:SDR family NAD(P)-dependent oxidoreductase [Aliiroseovarius sediminis]|uniref:SDR family NAD(P)-dependent oxidoreductase n=1 Tax=Aliiroseovarius sediminis TaxID=2925839 RepID=UPI001F55B637|nr:SDR family NAD(P)-dependent oxidoreductase [Aliiroseovarius sediminis]MCI2395407.1 SDR family NAD(P)-dependent oxidoreductase [Aliiroseovarius sediminis]
MVEFKGKTYWLIGASEGLGRALARDLDNEGARLVVSARSADRLQSLTDELSNARAVPFDVTDLDQVRDAVAQAGDVDGIVYIAGAYDPMRATEWDSKSAMVMCNVNFIGAMNVMGEVMPALTKKGRGDITLIGSLAGYRGLPASVGYSASKAAIVSLAETLRFDLKDTDIVVRIANPGFIKTRLTEKNSFKMPMLMSPDDAAKHVLKAMRKTRFRTDFPAPFSWGIRLLEYLPDLVVYRGK